MVLPLPPIDHLSRAIAIPLLTLSLGFGLLLGVLLSSLAIVFLRRPSSSELTSRLQSLLPVHSSAFARFFVRVSVTLGTTFLLSVPSFVLMFLVRELYLLEDELQKHLPFSHAVYGAVGIALIAVWYLGFMYIVMCSFEAKAGPLALLPASFRRDWKSRGKVARKEERLRRKETRAEEQRALLGKQPWEIASVRKRLGLGKLIDPKEFSFSYDEGDEDEDS